MARWLGLTAVLCTLAACGSSSAASSTAGAHTAGAPCGPARARTLASSGPSRVYLRGRSVYGCAAGSRRSSRLGATGPCPGGSTVGPVAVAGRLAAYATRSCGVDSSRAQIVVLRLTDGKQLSARPAFTLPAGPETVQSVGALVVTSGDKVAWISSSDSLIAHRQTSQVVAAASGAVRVLDSGAGIVPGSLRLHKGMLSWTRNGARHTAALP